MVSDYRYIAIRLGRKIKGVVIRKIEVEMGEQQDADNILRGNTVTGERRDKVKINYI